MNIQKMAIPAPRNSYPWKDLKKGEAFEVKNKSSGVMSSIASNQGKRDGRKYRVWTDEKGKVWCGRIK